MQIIITGRHFEITPSLKEYIQKKVSKVEKYFKASYDAHVTLSVEKHRHFAEVNIHVKGTRIYGKEETNDMYSSIDKVMNKVEQQVKKYKAKIKNKNQLDALDLKMNNFMETEDDGEDEDEAFADDFEGSLQRSKHPVIVRSQKINLKPMSAEEAVMHMNMRGNNFQVFLNSKGERVNVVYRMKDGNYGLIEA